jgi:Protein phosphatase 2C
VAAQDDGVCVTAESVAISGSRGPTADRLGHVNSIYWVLDGASPPEDEPRWNGLTHQLVDAYQAALHESAQSSGALESILRAASDRVANMWAAAPDTSDQFRPSATVAMVRVLPQLAEWLILGDTDVVWRSGADAGAATDDRLKTIAVRERSRYHRARSSNDSAALSHAHHELIAAELAARNRVDGYWVLTEAALPLGRAMHGTIALSEPWHILVSTDGLTKLAASDPNFEALVEDIEADGLAQVARERRDQAVRADDIAAWWIRS